MVDSSGARTISPEELEQIREDILSEYGSDAGDMPKAKVSYSAMREHFGSREVDGVSYIMERVAAKGEKINGVRIS